MPIQVVSKCGSAQKTVSTFRDMPVIDAIKNRIRVRVNGLLIENDSMLMVRLFSPVRRKLIWMPPGGGLIFGEKLEDALKREMLEECGVQVTPGPLWYLNEVLTDEIHAVEFYFRCERISGSVMKGSDPEFSQEEQIIRDVAFLPFDRLDKPDIYPAYLRKNFVRDLRALKKTVRHDKTAGDDKAARDAGTDHHIRVPKFI